MNAPISATAVANDPVIARVGQELEAAIDAGAIELPMLPETAMKVFRMAQDTEVDMKEVSELIEQDQKMASEVLRVVNSAAYSPHTEIVTLRQAVARLGLKPLSEIVIAAAFKSSVFEDDRFLEQMKAMSRSGIGCALWNKELSRLRRQNVETAYLCGLLHNVGQPMVLKYLSDLAEDAPDVPIDQAIEQLGPAIGLKLAQAWELPAPVAAAIRWHVDYVSATDYRDEASAVNASLLLCGITMEEDPATIEQQLTGQPVFQVLNVYPDELEKLLATRERMALQLESFQ